MTLNELIKSAQRISNLLSSGDIPVIHDGKEVDIYLALNTDTMEVGLFMTEAK